jgi:septal ring factor EnvC (AmiA/AmiB activator)
VDRDVDGMARFLLIIETVSWALIILAAICVSGKPVLADLSPIQIQNKIKEQEAGIKAAEEKISRSQEKMNKLVEQESPVILELERLNYQLNESRAVARAMRSETERLGRQIDATKRGVGHLSAEIEGLEGYAAERLVAFYKLGQLGISPILFSSVSFCDTQQRMGSLERILEHDANAWDTLQNKAKQLEALSNRLATLQQKHNVELSRCKEEMSGIAQRRTQRVVLLARIRKDKELTLAVIASSKMSARKLDESTRSLYKRIGTSENRATPGAFLAIKGLMPMPVSGDVVGFFGPYEKGGPYNVTFFRNGVNIKATPGIPVLAVHDGKVIYSNWFKGYGNIVIIDHGQHYCTLSAQLDQVIKKAGDQVVSGEAVGTVGDTATHAGPGLYFEIRHRGKPLDPIPWFKKTS